MNFQVGNAFTGVAPDTYTLTVRDAGDATCTATAEATVAGGPDTDSDGDGTVDCNDGCPYDPNKVAPGDCGCGVPDTDTDGDGVADCNDNCIYTANPGQEDTDNDGIGDACDECPTDPDKFEAGICGCFVPETDCIDACAAFNALVNNVMEDDTDANNGQKNSLITKLHRAKLQFEEGDNNNAVNMLNAFINQVQALSGGNNKPIPQAIADDWVAIAQNLIDNISNNSAVCVQALISGSNPTNTTASADYTSMPDLTTEPNAGQKDILMLEASPNPFANDVSLQIDLPEAGKVNLSIFNLQGQRVITLIDRTLDTGQHRMEWDGYSQAGKALPAGVYLVQLQTENDLINLQLVLMK
ncbi:MAG: T9SS type A sorting domain-containing protein [Lewinellaceae bacterium]|nr:T9SS type A sorting domain-containing protein [Lewinellaceae bacterium]